MSSPNGEKPTPDATKVQTDVALPVVATRTCSVDLPDGSPCSAPVAMGSYCADHSVLADRDFQIFQLVHGHMEQDLREFWQRSNFYLVVDGLILSALASSHSRSLQILLATAGIVISFFWLLTAQGSVMWIRMWRDEVRRLDRVVDRFQSFDAVEGHVLVNKLRSPSWVTQWLPVFFLTGWIVILILVILRTTI